MKLGPLSTLSIDMIFWFWKLVARIQKNCIPSYEIVNQISKLVGDLRGHVTQHPSKSLVQVFRSSWTRRNPSINAFESTLCKNPTKLGSIRSDDELETSCTESISGTDIKILAVHEGRWRELAASQKSMHSISRSVKMIEKKPVSEIPMRFGFIDTITSQKYDYVKYWVDSDVIGQLTLLCNMLIKAPLTTLSQGRLYSDAGTRELFNEDASLEHKTRICRES